LTEGLRLAAPDEAEDFNVSTINGECLINVISSEKSDKEVLDMPGGDYTRREFLKKTAGLAAVSAVVPGFVSAGTASRKRPNVVLILTDDQGYGDLGCHGHPVLQTPNMDKLYSDSVRFTDFHVGPTCSPTRASLMTGRYCNRTGVWHTIQGRSLLRRDEVTMADVFSASGYRTGIFGKWHLGDNYPFRPQDRGFDEVLIHKGGGVGQGPDYWGNDYFDDTYFRNGKPEKFIGYCTDIWFDEAMKFIESNKGRPFFCYLSTNAAHSPHRVADEYSRPYEDEGVKSETAGFYGQIANIDDNIGRLMKRLDELGLSDKTVLIFMTDNGATGASRSGEWFNAAMRGRKGSEYEGGHRVPCFMRYPAGRIGSGRNIGCISAHIDLLPTLIELCYLKRPKGVKFDGASLVPLPVKWRKSAVMTNRWRLVNGSELYDINKDAGQKNDIAEKYPDVVKRLRESYDAWWQGVSKRFDEYCRIVIGSDKENPTRLMSHDIHGKAIWSQFQVRNGQHTNGFWAVEIAGDGDYEFELRRWPREFDRPISSAISSNSSKAGKNNIPVTHARLKIADIDLTEPITAGAKGVKFKVKLRAGKTTLQCWFVNAQEDGESSGVYYVYARRLP